MRRAVLLVPVLAAGCSLLGGKKKDDTPDQVWTRFNSEDDVVFIEVTEADTDSDAPPAEAIRQELHSSTGLVEIGYVLVTPGSGPVGTTHEVVVHIDGGDSDDPWFDQVQKVEFEADAGDRGTWTIELEQDSANHGVWYRDIQSYGDVGEVRTDTFAFSLWHLEDALPEDAAVQE